MGRTKPTARFVYDSSTVLATTADSNITFTNVTSNTSDITYSDGVIYLKVPGVYRITANLTVIATAAGSVGAALYEGSSIIPGARAVGTASAIGDAVSMAFSAISTVKPGSAGSYAQLTLKSTYAASFEVANVIIEKVD